MIFLILVRCNLLFSNAMWTTFISFLIYGLSHIISDLRLSICLRRLILIILAFTILNLLILLLFLWIRVRLLYLSSSRCFESTEVRQSSSYFLACFSHGTLTFLLSSTLLLLFKPLKCLLLLLTKKFLLLKLKLIRLESLKLLQIASHESCDDLECLFYLKSDLATGISYIYVYMAWKLLLQ